MCQMCQHTGSHIDMSYVTHYTRAHTQTWLHRHTWALTQRHRGSHRHMGPPEAQTWTHMHARRLTHRHTLTHMVLHTHIHMTSHTDMASRTRMGSHTQAHTQIRFTHVPGIIHRDSDMGHKHTHRTTQRHGPIRMVSHIHGLTHMHMGSHRDSGTG